jgi:hypothetical protein
VSGRSCGMGRDPSGTPLIGVVRSPANEGRLACVCLSYCCRHGTDAESRRHARVWLMLHGVSFCAAGTAVTDGWHGMDLACCWLMSMSGTVDLALQQEQSRESTGQILNNVQLCMPDAPTNIQRSESIHKPLRRVRRRQSALTKQLNR